MKRTFIILLMVCNLIACNKKSEELPSVNFNDVSEIDLKYEIPLDSVVERTQIIRFTSDTDLIIGKIKTVVESNDCFYLVEYNRILRFDKNGRFLNFIGKKGKGPGEFISPWTLEIDEDKQHIYVLDYYGQKMLRYTTDGSFDNKYALPELFTINGFKLYKGKILYTSEVNSTNPELYLYDQNKDVLTELSKRNREMIAGEGLMGANFLMNNGEDLQLFHYFNDTVFSLADQKLNPEYLIRFGKLKFNFDEINVNAEKKSDGSRAQVYNLIKGERYTFIRYGVSRINNKKQQTMLTGLYSNDLSNCCPSVNMICRENPLYSIKSGNKLIAGKGNTLLRTVSAINVLAADPGFNIAEKDNPILLKYFLR